MSKKYLTITLLITSLALSACAVGPDFSSPENSFIKQDDAINKLQKYTTREKTPEIKWQDENNRLSDEENINWWQSFNNQTINYWVKKARENSPDINIAHAALLQAGAYVKEARAQLYPQVSLTGGALRQKSAVIPLNDDSPTTEYSLYNAGININYIFDVSGGVRRAREHTVAGYESQLWQTKAAYLAISANVVNSLINLSAINEEITANQQIIDLQKSQFEKNVKQREIGVLSDAEILPLKASLSANQAVMPTLISQKINLENQLLALAGEYPTADSIEIKLDEIALPQQIPLWLPSEILRRRADIRSAEAKLHQATAGVGVAQAGYYPQVGIAGSLSSQVVSLSNLFNTTLWSVAASITQKLFSGGETSAKKSAADAALLLSQAQYEKVVINAFSEVSTLLSYLASDAESLALQKIARDNSLQTYHLYKEKFAVGSASAFDLINAEQNYLQANVGYIKSKARQFSNIVSLYLAAGGEVDLDELAEKHNNINQSEENALLIN